MEEDSEGGQAEADVLGTADEVAYFRVALGGKPEDRSALLEKDEIRYLGGEKT